MADFERPEIGADTGQRPVRRFVGGGGLTMGARPGLGYGRTGGALPPGQVRQGGAFPGQGGGVAGGFPGQGGGVAGGFPGQAGSPRVAPISLPPQGPPNPMPAFRNVDPAAAGPGMTPPVAEPPRPVVAPSPPVAPVGTGGMGQAPPVQPGIAPQGTGEMVAPTTPILNKPVNPTMPVARPGMMNQPINYAAGLGGFAR